MSNKLNRVGISQICHNGEEVNTIAGSWTGGSAHGTVDWITRMANLIIPYRNGMSSIQYNASGVLTANTSSGIAQQCGISVPDANTYACEVFGQFEGNVPAGVLVVPFFGTLAAADTFATALTDNKTVKRGMHLEAATMPSGWTARSYRAPAVVHQEPLTKFVHGWRFINTTGSDVSLNVFQAKFGFRGLDNTMNYFDPVR